MTITQVITALPDAPDPAIDPPSVFSQKAAASVLAQKGLPPQLNAFAEQANATATQVNTDMFSASASAMTASNAAALVLSAGSVSPWVSGATYQQSQAVISQVNFQTYRRVATAGASTIDPANDFDSWRVLVGNGANGVFIPVELSTPAVDLSQGNYFIYTLNSNVGLNINNPPRGGCSFTLEINHVNGSLTLPASVTTPSAGNLTLTPGKTHLLFFVTSNGGAKWRISSAINYNT